MAAMSRFWAWWHGWASPPVFYGRASVCQPFAAAAAAGLLGGGLVWGLAVAPPDYLQGDSMRIIYIHVPAAMLAQSLYLAMAAAGLVLLVWRIKMAQIFMAVAAPVGAAMTVLALATGSIWGRPTWGTWWEWDARMTSTLILLFLYLGVMALRQALGAAAARGAALLALVGAVNLPIIKYSVVWWNTLHQGDTFRLTAAPSMPPSMYLPLLVMVLGFYAFALLLLLLRMRTEIVRSERGSGWVRGLL